MQGIGMCTAVLSLFWVVTCGWFFLFLWKQVLLMFVLFACTLPFRFSPIQLRSFSLHFHYHIRYPLFTLFFGHAMHDPRAAVDDAMHDPRPLATRQNAECSLNHWHEDFFFVPPPPPLHPAPLFPLSLTPPTSPIRIRLYSIDFVSIRYSSL